MYPAAVLLFDFSCDAPFIFLYFVQHFAPQVTQSEVIRRTLQGSVILWSKEIKHTVANS
jgi:hypothetical protein